MNPIAEWLRENRVTEVECVVADINGIARGKILPAYKFIRSLDDDTLRLPESVFIQTVAGEFPEHHVIDPTDRDVVLRPDPAARSLVPWYQEPTAQIIHDCFYYDGSPVWLSSRQVLKHVIALYNERGWRPVVAPELEFFLTKINTDPDYPLEPPVGRSKRPESGRQSYGIEAANEFDPVFEDVYDWCEIQEIDVDTLSHESGRAQMEINFNHGDPMALADQVFLFKRTVKQAALKHGIYATFMAKPMEGEPGSSMHIHQSVYDIETGRNLFEEDEGQTYRPLFLNFIGGLQKNLAAVMPLIAPNVNSYRRLRRYTAAPVNVHWGLENRTVGLRVPASRASARRVENRVAGADTNPYLAIAATLACGYIGMVDGIEPAEPVSGDAYRLAHNLPQQMPDGLRKLQQASRLKEVLGEDFVKVLLAVKQTEHDAYQNVISSWEREHLLLNV
jgi:glutamine synthetase